ncbi:MAG TPA: hypothetical protein VKU83_03130 [Puia sp.]|nr:hypothetical protein [Puia sp.]
MEPVEIRGLLEKYWLAETTVAEEEQLAAWFRQQQEIPADLEPLRELFTWRVEESQVVAGEDLDRRILQRISRMESGGTVIPFRMAAAAAVVVSLAMGLLIAVTAPRSNSTLPGAARRDAAPGAALVQVEKDNGQKTGGQDATLRVKDTYTDPRQALAAVRNALLLASVRINEGAQITQKNITRLHNSWEVATGD